MIEYVAQGEALIGPMSKISVIIGLNGVGKTTLLRKLRKSEVGDSAIIAVAPVVRGVIVQESQEATTFQHDGEVWTVIGNPPRSGRVVQIRGQSTIIPLTGEGVRRISDLCPGWEDDVRARANATLPGRDYTRIEVDANGGALDNALAFVYFHGSWAINVSDLSDGELKVIRTLVAVGALECASSDGKPGLVLIDDIEAFLSPSSLRNLLDVIADVARRTPIQFVMATHSCVVPMWAMTAIRNGVVQEGDVSFHFLERIQGRMTARVIDAEHAARLLA